MNKDSENTCKRPLLEGHRERLRRRMERDGWDAMKPHEMLELVLNYAIPRQDLSYVCRELVDRFGSVGGVFSASGESLLEVPGMTQTLTNWILTTGELMRAYCDLQPIEGIRLSCYQDMFEYLKPRIGQRGDEKLWVIYADFDFNLITYTEFRFEGAWWNAENVRRIVAEAVHLGAKYVYMVQFLEQSASDIESAEKQRLEGMAVTFRGVDVELVDYILVNGEELTSLNAERKLENVRKSSGCLSLHERYSSPRGSEP